jgi:hypothetical protein
MPEEKLQRNKMILWKYLFLDIPRPQLAKDYKLKKQRIWYIIKTYYERYKQSQREGKNYFEGPEFQQGGNHE